MIKVTPPSDNPIKIAENSYGRELEKLKYATHGNGQEDTSAKMAYDPKYEKFRNRYKELYSIPKESYFNLHKGFLRPTNLVIDCDLFEKEIEKLHPKFTRWANGKEHLPRYGLGLADLENSPPYEGDIPPCNYPSDKWSLLNPDYPLFDVDYHIVNEHFKSLTSFDEYLQIFGDYMARSCILWWNTGGGFVPHIDTIIPTTQIRFWGTNDPDNYDFSYREGKEFVEVDNIERGRIYLCDTSMQHTAWSRGENVYTFFFALHPLAYDLVEEHLL